MDYAKFEPKVTLFKDNPKLPSRDKKIEHINDNPSDLDLRSQTINALIPNI